MTKISIYQVFTRLFGNKTTTPIANGNIQENGCGKMNDFTPKALEEIKNLGINYIWYTGIIRHATTSSFETIEAQEACIVKGKAGSPYSIMDYYDVQPDLAEKVDERMSEFENLVERTHATGLKMLIDFIPNHVSRAYKSQHKPTHTPDLGENDDNNQAFAPQNNFYYLPGQDLQLNFCEQNNFKEQPAKVTGNDCFHAHPEVNDWYEAIKLNYGVDIQNGHQHHFHPIPNTWTRMLEILQFWAKKGIDGFRCDMVEMVTVDFWAWAIPQVKEINPDLIFVAEVYQPHLYHDYIKKGKFDYLYDKVGLYDILKSVIRGEQPASMISNAWKSLNGLDKHMLRFLENHDEQRIASPYFATDAFKAIPAMMLSASMHTGPIMTYFGQEFGETAKGSTGFSGDDGRTTIFDYWNIPSIQRWNEQTLDFKEQALQKEYKKILQFCTNNIEVAHGEFYDLMWANKDNPQFYHNYIFAYFRSYKGKIFLFVLNFSNQKLKQNIIIPGHALEFAQKDTTKLKDKFFHNVFTNEDIRISHYDLVQKGLEVEIPPHYYLVFEF